MQLTRRNLLVYGLLGAFWVLVLGWQVEEHARVREAEKNELRNRAADIGNTVGAIIRSLRFRLGDGSVIYEASLEPLLKELVYGRTNQVNKTGELLSVMLLNLADEQVASAGRPIDLQREDLRDNLEHWGQTNVILVTRVNLGASTAVLPSPERQPSPPSFPSTTNEVATNNSAFAAQMDRPPPPGRPRGRSYPWWVGPRQLTSPLTESELERQTLHGMVLAMSTEGLEGSLIRDLWLRTFIILLATVSVVGSGFALRNLERSSQLKIRLVRASELTSHLREMNLAAAGLAHETRNPLNIIRGLAQMISKQPDISPAVCQKSRDIVDQADRVAAQLNEFINYSRPREVRRTVLALGAVVNEVARALSYDLEEKKIRLVVKGEQLHIEADEQMLRQVLFNLILNASQAVNGEGEIQVFAQRQSASEAVLEVRDNGPGVSPEHRSEIFRPYFTTQKTGTGLGLAVVQQIILAHGWEIECLPNQPTGAVFRISHLKLAA